MNMIQVIKNFRAERDRLGTDRAAAWLRDIGCTEGTIAEVIAAATLVDCIRRYIRVARKDGVVGMSVGNLKQCVSTRGLMCTKPVFDRAFGVAVDFVRDKTRDFAIYE